MAWIGIIVGTFAGVFSAVAAYALYALPLWYSLMLYPTVGTTSAILTILVMIHLPPGLRPMAQPHPDELRRTA
ncbi:hypothetical protein K4K96_12310 [Phaeobacter inhibens]|uniref:hypothetical protein n=1 Tax=Phaeobacter inhibens TaxID=221822 RepID=UPI0009717A7E|nr:hypothetical protein [Phaeobacter inhibens]APX15501.1 hypothetical protein BWR17_06435 [Phaeobacter inhibens]UWR91478.1 hypothetical protein K4K96_12310 [Phaeobacter inhibens]